MRTVEEEPAVSGEDRSPEARAGAMQLFRWELSRTRLSYLAAALLSMVSGAIAGVLVDGVFVLEGFGEAGSSFEQGFNAGGADMWFLALTPAFLINFAFNEYYSGRFAQDNFTRWLRFLGTLPVSAGSVVASRALSALLSLAVSVPPFFAVLYLTSDEFLRGVSTAEYLSFAAVWIAYALVVGGFYLYVWLGFSGRTDLWISLSLMAAILLTVFAGNLAFDEGIALSVLALAQEHGLLAGACALALGVCGFALWMLAAARRLSRREL